MELYLSILILIGTGTFAGFAGGLLGLGGAFIMTPVQFWVYTEMGLSADAAIKTAFGTSLLVILPTAVSGAWRHHLKQAVLWRTAIIMGTCSFVFALVGAVLASYIPGEALKITFGTIALLSCIRMLTSIREKEEAEAVSNPWVWAAWAAPIGLLAGLLGVGGGVIMIPILVLALKFRMRNAIAISLAVIIFTSVGGIIGYLINGAGAEESMPYSIGYINLLSFVLLAVPSAVMAQVGAIISHKMPQKPLTYIFIALLFYFGLRMIGVFEWLGWPL